MISRDYRVRSHRTAAVWGFGLFCAVVFIGLITMGFVRAVDHSCKHPLKRSTHLTTAILEYACPDR